jgi:RNA polymerase sigma-70 factor (ECF subfamily)
MKAGVFKNNKNSMGFITNLCHFSGNRVQVVSGFRILMHCNIVGERKEATRLIEEAQVIALVRSGKIDAFAGIVEHYQASIIRYLYRLTGDYEMAKDLAQDTFIQAYKSILKTDAELSLKAWLYRIATNNALQHHRRKKLLSFVPFALKEHNIAAEGDPNDPAGEMASIRDTLHRIPEEQRTCLVLHFIEGFKYREIAETLNISEEAVRKRVARGKKSFIQEYNRGGGGTE